ncbi:hypothetical protein [Micromonospora auratinigra]|uniref:Uncharacterized protein n=1 Tax=Micromonospora auratinigra TaxID=261654 RepID=A0A1A8ZA37_9ACTN|nr:hypothetical protein [Micromonospora auratinigra]SBT40733.1 hypothetical protein GA0070611_1361 [Micromonospora auratinigra]
MNTRPTEEWGREVRNQKRRIAAGILAEDAAYALHLWPEAFIAAVDTALDAYEADVRSLSHTEGVARSGPETLPGMPPLPMPSPSDNEVVASVERLVMALNAINEERGRIETDEREELCQYIDDVLTDAGIDVEALTARRDIARTELTDEWREW